MKLGKFNNYLPANPPSVQGKAGAVVKVAASSPLLTQELKTPATELLKLLQPGQQISATVIKQLPSQGLLQIQIGSTILNAQTELKLPAGTPIKLEFIKLGAIPELKLIPLLSETAQVISHALKQSLPKQLPVSSFLNQLQTTLSNKQLAVVLPKQVNQLIKQIITDISPREALIQPNTLKKLVSQSGIFLEKQLVQASTSAVSSSVLHGDNKARLLVLLHTLQTAFKPPPLKLPASALTASAAHTSGTQAASTPELTNSKLLPELILKNNLSPSNTATTTAQQTALLPQLAAELRELIGKTEGAVAKIVLDQLASLPKEESLKQSWQLELPFLSGGTQTDSLKLTITQEDVNSSSEKEASWSVVLEITPPGLGTIYSKIILNGNQVDSYFWSEDAVVCDLIENHLNDLAKRLSSVGLETGQLGTRNGKPVEADCPKSEEQLVSERA